jgi:hypothetical protein
MIKSMNNTRLALILAALLAMLAIFKYIGSKKSENTFKTVIIPKIDTAKVTGIEIFPKKKKTSPIVISKKGNTWYATQGDITSRAEARSGKYLMGEILKISPDRLATNDVAQWKDYDVTDTAGARLVLFNNKDTILDIIVGRFSYFPATKKLMSFVRINGQKEVYGTEGMLSLNIPDEFASWRDKHIIPDDYKQWKSLTFSYPADSGFMLKKDSAGWEYADGSKPDSASTVAALTTLSQQNYGSFIDKFDTNGKQELFSLLITGSASGNVMLKAYPADTANKYAITSTLNPGSYFSGKNSGLFSKIFISKAALVKKTAPSAGMAGGKIKKGKPLQKKG